jgi:hypothetical protein
VCRTDGKNNQKFYYQLPDEAASDVVNQCSESLAS